MRAVDVAVTVIAVCESIIARLAWVDDVVSTARKPAIDPARCARGVRVGGAIVAFLVRPHVAVATNGAVRSSKGQCHGNRIHVQATVREMGECAYVIEPL